LKQVPIIIHMPHWSTFIPADCRKEILLSDDALNTELLCMTDLHTELAGRGNWAYAVVAANVSRLVVDVERFRDDSEECMAAKGMGAGYTHTHDGSLFRRITSVRREELLRRYYDTHHLRLEKAV